MPLFTKPSPALVYDLINESNPDLPVPLTPVNSKLSAPRVASVAQAPLLNTAVDCIAKGGDYLGRKAFNYRRLVFSTLFRGMLIQINKYSANQSTSSSTVFTVYNLLQAINQRYGLNLTTDDVIDANITRGDVLEDGFYARSITVNAKPTSLGYTGSFTLKWRGDGQDIGSMISVTDLEGTRSFPGGNDFSGAHDVVVSNMAYGIDWSDFALATPWGGYPSSFSSGSAQSLTFMPLFIAELNRLYGTTLSVTNPVGGYSAWNPRVVDLSTVGGKASAPEANAEYYNRVLILTVPEADEAVYGAGTHYIHYNV